MALKTGANVAEFERMFGVDNLGERIKRLQVAKYYGWSLTEIDEMTEAQFDDAYAYMGAIGKMSEAKK